MAVIDLSQEEKKEPFPANALDYLNKLYSAVSSKPSTPEEKLEYWRKQEPLMQIPEFAGDLEQTLRSLEFYHLVKMGML